MTGRARRRAGSAFVEKVNAALDDLRGSEHDVVSQVPSAFPLPEDRQSDPAVAALGPIPPRMAPPSCSP